MYKNKYIIFIEQLREIPALPKLAVMAVIGGAALVGCGKKDTPAQQTTLAELVASQCQDTDTKFKVDGYVTLTKQKKDTELETYMSGTKSVLSTREYVVTRYALTNSQNQQQPFIEIKHRKEAKNLHLPYVSVKADNYTGPVIVEGKLDRDEENCVFNASSIKRQK